jgi:hypothetical protein
VEVSTNKWCAEKKSAPKIGFATAAKMNGTSGKILPLKQTDRYTLPQLEIPFPSAPARAGPCSAAIEAE